jgi:ElaB/YqjD/DUF883 family membrane-anchored ribosome-binding protein
MQSVERDQLVLKLEAIKAARREATKSIQKLEELMKKSGRAKGKKTSKNKKQADELVELKV